MVIDCKAVIFMLSKFLNPFIGLLRGLRRLLLENKLLALVLLVALVRLAMLGSYPLMDTTEARYGEIGRVMAEKGDWITPWFRPGIPFWAKPPLSFWFTALSFKLFGVNEFTARLPHWILGVVGGWLVWDLGWRRSAREAVIAVCLLTGCLIYYFSSGAVMTDMALSLGLTLSMWSFWLAVQPNQKRSIKPWASWIFFASLGWGLLAKGPLAVVLAGLSVLTWLALERSYWPLVRKLPWIQGGIITALIACPWYLLAEQKTPGFLNYFLIGEHINRYLVPGWHGDRYGHAHNYPHGTIWIFLLLMLIPWTILIPIFLRPIRISQARATIYSPDTIELSRPWRNYLLSWGIIPALFFTFAGNIIMPYVLPEIPALALLGAFYLVRYESREIDRLLTSGLCIVMFLSILFVFIFPLTGYGDRKSERALVGYALSAGSGNQKLIYLGKYPYSAAFYSEGNVSDAKDAKELEVKLQEPVSALIAIGNDHGADIDVLISTNLKKLHVFPKYTLYEQAKGSRTTPKDVP
jgi:4-amino-4-deoxy-L-arabinose transferase-like glycosyltransferase